MTTKITEKNISSLANIGVNWQSVVVADGSTGLTAVAGRGYFINTTSGTITVTFPASPTAGDTIVINDYATTFATNNVTINLNGNKLEAETTNAILSTNDQTHTFVFTDATQGWKIVNQDTGTSIQATFISATGGTVTTSGNFKIHTFTGDGCFVVATLGNPTGGGSTVDYLVVAGGGSGGSRVCGNQQAGGGGGGFRFSAVNAPVSGSPAAPLAAPSNITVTTTTYPITVGGGGAAVYGSPATTGVRGNQGSNSVFSTITSTGGGSGGAGTGNGSPVIAGGSGGSGGGTGGGGPSGFPAPAGNTPPTSPSQGNPGGPVPPGNSPDNFASGSGGAGGSGTSGTNSNASNAGVGAGLPSGFGTTGQLSGGHYYYSGGGGAGGLGPLGGRPGGTGGGGPGSDHPSNPPAAAVSGTTNTGGGGGGGGAGGGHPFPSGAGGSGIVIVTYKFQ